LLESPPVSGDYFYDPIGRTTEQLFSSMMKLIDDLRENICRLRIKIILIKVNICRTLEEPLKAAGFKVIHNGLTVPFPGSGQQENFLTAIKQIL
jgi:hypothetical protein